jgi:predicted MPP superfamily phosphohydrolase
VADIVEHLPWPVFGVLLFGIALAATRLELVPALALYGFMLGDWLALALLPRVRRSFGPHQPPTLLLALFRAPFALLPLPYWPLAQLLGTALVLYGFWVEPHRVQLTRQTLESTKGAFSRPLRVLHLGDLHVERRTRREEAVLEIARQVRPDLILFSGDFLNLSFTHDETALRDTRDVLTALDAPLGVYAVSGSPAVDPPDVVARILDGLENIRWLRNERVTIEHDGDEIELIGLDCTHRPFLDGPRLKETLNGHSERLHILLYHTPDLAPEAAAAGIDLQLSGHTHGGQVRLPWYGALYAASLYGKRFESGRRTVGQMTLYVTRGIGLEGGGAPRVRFNCAPEVVLWEIGGPERG